MANSSLAIKLKLQLLNTVNSTSSSQVTQHQDHEWGLQRGTFTIDGLQSHTQRHQKWNLLQPLTQKAVCIRHAISTLATWRNYLGSFENSQIPDLP